MKKLKFLILYGLKKRLLKKSFLISNIIIGLLTILIINLPTIIGLFENDDYAFVRIAYVVDEASLGYISQLDETLNQGLEEDIFIFYETQESMKDTFFEQNEYDILLMIQSDNGRLSLDLYRFETTYDTVITQTIQFLDVFSQNQAYVPPVIDSFLPDDYEDPFINEIISGISSVFTLPLFLIMTFGIQFVGVDIIEEK